MFEEGREAEVQAAAREWPFFHSLLDLLEMVLAKADPDIAAYYDRVLVPDELRPLGQELRGKCRRTHRGGAAGQAANGDNGKPGRAGSALLAEDPDLRRTIELRNPYVDPLNLLQAELLRRARTSDEAGISDALLVTVNGIAAGMRNTG